MMDIISIKKYIVLFELESAAKQGRFIGNLTQLLFILSADWSWGKWFQALC